MCEISIWSELLGTLFLVDYKGFDVQIVTPFAKMKGRRVPRDNKEFSVYKLKSFMVFFSRKEGERDG